MRRLANELLAAAAQHAIVTDELQDLEALRKQRDLTRSEVLQAQDLRRRKLVSRLRHDRAHRRLMAMQRQALVPRSPERAIRSPVIRTP